MRLFIFSLPTVKVMFSIKKTLYSTGVSVYAVVMTLHTEFPYSLAVFPVTIIGAAAVAVLLREFGWL